jgi:hypothetical protein
MADLGAELVERIARLMHETSRRWRVRNGYRTYHDSWEDLPEDSRAEFRAVALAVLDAVDPEADVPAVVEGQA